MLAIRLQRVGRKGHPIYRVAVQEAHRHPSSGRVVEYIGTYDPHTKKASIKTEAAQARLSHGAQPTPRVARIFKDAGIELPSWVKGATEKSSKIRNPEKLRKNQPKEEVAEESAE